MLSAKSNGIIVHYNNLSRQQNTMPAGVAAAYVMRIPVDDFLAFFNGPMSMVAHFVEMSNIVLRIIRKLQVRNGIDQSLSSVF